MKTLSILIGGSPAGPGGFSHKAMLAGLRALRTLIQGVAAALVTAFGGKVAFDASYAKTFGFLCLSALVTAAASFLNNVATFLPTDPTQRQPD